MAALTTALDTEFTPAVGDFIVQVTAGPANLLRKNAAGADFAVVQALAAGSAVVVSNPVAGAVYMFTALVGTPSVRADQ